MEISGYLSVFSVAEVLQVLDRGRKTGLLLIQAFAQGHHNQIDPVYHIWLSQGRIVAISARSDQQGLLTMITDRHWLSPQVAQQLTEKAVLTCPLGFYLKDKGILSAEQLTALFHAQVIRQICTLFQATEGYFQFGSQVELPQAEMTGLSVAVPDAVLLGFRVLKDWTGLTQQLPKPTFVLSKIVLTKSSLALDSLERRVWQTANGNQSIQTIANQLYQPLEIIQQIAFRLIAIGMLEAIPQYYSLPSAYVIKSIPNPIIDEPIISEKSLVANIMTLLTTPL